jgi:hypothetical protein
MHAKVRDNGVEREDEKLDLIHPSIHPSIGSQLSTNNPNLFLMLSSGLCKATSSYVLG